MVDLTLNRTIKYKDIIYRIVETLSSDHLLVVEEAEFRKNEFPMSVYIIPGV